MAFTEKPLVYDYIKTVIFVDTFFLISVGVGLFILFGISVSTSTFLYLNPYEKFLYL